ncbi:hypothetical protein KW787_01930 [Candidatus Pacearchaeota archaeon]|nr:hypothetical protein [Candidatus Pacearchaeota archaeon]
MELKKRGIFFSTDALIAVSIVLLVIAIAYPIVSYQRPKTDIHYDIITTLSALKIGEIDNLYVKSLIADGSITNLNNSLLEQIGDFYATNITRARELGDSVLSTIDSKYNVGIWYGGTLISAKNTTPFETAKQIDTAIQIISGLKEGGSAKGYSARGYLSNQLKGDYYYFGGYVGDGIISRIVNYTGNLSAASMEIVASSNFSLYVNGYLEGSFAGSPSETTPSTYTIPLTHFTPDKTIIEFRGTNLHITGGYIKISYQSSAQYQKPKYYFPGVNGIINLYDGLYVPNTLSSMNIFIHYNSSYQTFLIIGNITVFNSSTPSETSVTLNNAYLSSLLDYSSFANQTVPIRLGLLNVTYAPGNNAYIISVVDLSGGVSSARASGCGNDGLCAAQKANYLLVNSLLNLNNTALGIVGLHQGNVNPLYSYPLSQNKTALNNTISGWSNNGNLDLCYGIKNATDTLKDISGDSLKSIILLGTKFPNSCLGSSGNVFQDTYNLACQSWTNYSIRINTIGVIGNSQSDANLGSLLYNISRCTNATYYNQSAGNNDLVDLYNRTLNDILNLTYYLQTASSSGNIMTTLYPDSYIDIDYNAVNPYGLIVTAEKMFSNTTSGSFDLPQNSSIVETRVISYSGPKWTALVKANTATIYNLTRYGTNYIKLGDPYAINIPNNYITSTNNLAIQTGTGPSNLSAGSSYNKIIYTVKKNVSSYTPIVASAQGCSWTLQHEDGTNTTIQIPYGYSGPNTCSYTLLQRAYNQNDALQAAAYSVIKELDFDGNGKLDVKLTQNDIQISSSEVQGIPFIWSTEVQARAWT